jgi:outer membrane protein OmpA-like peptidoglycan-associated protein
MRIRSGGPIPAVLAALLAVTDPAGAVETNVPGVSAQIAYARQYDGVLRLGIALENGTTHEVQGREALDYAQVLLVDRKANKKRFALKDADGHYLAGPVSDWNGGGRWFPKLQPGSTTVVWVLFEAVAADSHVTVQAPVIGHFEDVAVREGPPAPGSAVPSSLAPLTATLESATRADAQLHVLLKLVNPGNRRVSGPALAFRDVYALDPQGKRAYPLLKGSDGLYLAEPMSDHNEGGRWFLSKVEPGGQAFLNLTFQAPPDGVARVDVIVPQFSPFEAVAIAGTGGAAASGVAVAGKSVDLERALKDLHAEVAGDEIKVNLAADLLFDFDKAELQPQAAPSLTQVATVVRSYPGAQVMIEGHTDGKGDAAYNQKLSERRAATVAAWLASRLGPNAARIETRGWGKSRPIAPNALPDGSDDPVGRARNRRVEIRVRKS